MKNINKLYSNIYGDKRNGMDITLTKYTVVLSDPDEQMWDVDLSNGTYEAYFINELNNSDCYDVNAFYQYAIINKRIYKLYFEDCIEDEDDCDEYGNSPVEYIPLDCIDYSAPYRAKLMEDLSIFPFLDDEEN